MITRYRSLDSQRPMPRWGLGDQGFANIWFKPGASQRNGTAHFKVCIIKDPHQFWLVPRQLGIGFAGIPDSNRSVKWRKLVEPRMGCIPTVEKSDRWYHLGELIGSKMTFSLTSPTMKVGWVAVVFRYWAPMYRMFGRE